MRQPALVIFPRGDLDFVAAVYSSLTDHADTASLQERLREAYPLAVVRRRELSAEPTTIWYVYRDGGWKPEAAGEREARH